MASINIATARARTTTAGESDSIARDGRQRHAKPPIAIAAVISIRAGGL
jgi:hypothetical protein